MRFPAPSRLGQPAAPRDATCPTAVSGASRLVAAAGLAALLPGAAAAQACPPAPGEMCDLGTEKLGPNFVFEAATAVTNDGSTVVGNDDLPVAQRGFLWTPQAGLSLLPIPGVFSAASDISGDGKFVVGYATPNPFSSQAEAVRWSEIDGMESLGLGANSTASATNRDGSVIVGALPGARPFKWIDGQGVSTLPGINYDGSGTGHARSISGDGRVVVGEANSDIHGVRRAVMWTQGGNVLDLGTLRSDNTGFARAQDISNDGKVAIGVAATAENSRAFRWTMTTGMDDLGTFRQDDLGWSEATATNGDGSIVVGFADADAGIGSRPAVLGNAFELNGRAFLWSETLGMRDLGTLKANNTGVSYAYDVTSDGALVVGAAENDAGEMRAFIWRADTMLDHVNTGIAVQQSAQALAATAAHYGQNTVYQLGREVALRGPGGGDGARVSSQGNAAQKMPVAVRFGGRLAHTEDVATSGGADVTAAVGLTPTLTLGGFVEIMDETDSHSVVSLDGTHIAGGASLRYRAAPDGTGLTWRVAAVRGGGDFDVTRRDILPHTERGEGATSLTTTGLSAEIGYGYAVPRGVVTPFVRLTGSRVERDGFAESDAIGFPLTYDDHEDEALTVTLGVDARLDVSAQGTLELGAGISHDLDRDTDPVTGTSAIPGFTDFSVDGPDLENRTRGYVSAGYSHALGAGRAVTGRVSVSQSPWTDDVSVGARLGYEMRF